MFAKQARFGIVPSCRPFLDGVPYSETKDRQGHASNQDVQAGLVDHVVLPNHSLQLLAAKVKHVHE